LGPLGFFPLYHQSRADDLGRRRDGRSSQYQRTLENVLERVKCLLRLGGPRKVVGLLHQLVLWQAVGMAIRVRVPGTRWVPDPMGTGVGTIFHPWVAPIPNPA
jgi:hypothetical protein